MESVMAVRSALKAMTVAVPSETPVIIPDESTDTIALLVLCQTIFLFSALAGVTATDNCFLKEGRRSAAISFIVILLTCEVVSLGMAGAFPLLLFFVQPTHNNAYPQKIIIKTFFIQVRIMNTKKANYQ